MERQFDINALAGLLNKSFPDLVRISEDGAIILMEKIRITQEGVVEGKGPAADKAKTIYEQFMRSQQGSHVASGPKLLNPKTGMKVRFRCQHCGISLGGRVYRRSIAGSILFFCCKQCADHHETESSQMQGKPI